MCSAEFPDSPALHLTPKLLGLFRHPLRQLAAVALIWAEPFHARDCTAVTEDAADSEFHASFLFFVMLSQAHARIGSVPLDNSHGDPHRLKAVESRDDRLDQRFAAKTDDETLVAETLATKRWAQREIWYRFAPMVQGLLRRSLSAHHDHDDLAQEVFLRVFRRLHTLEKPSALRSFIYSVAVRVVSEEIRHFQVLRRARTQLVLMAHEGGNSGADFEGRDTLVRIQHILDGMKDKHRAVFVLRHVEGMDLQEIAAGLNISLATVKRYLVKATCSIQRAVVRDEGLHASLACESPARTSGGSP
jgi:RNA polymerase sigma-70 factor, ECF subfamily